MKDYINHKYNKEGKESMVLITIIIPHYNNWTMLFELLDTIPTNPLFEVIVIDDNSDDYEKKIKFLKEQYPNVLVKNNNTGSKGAGAARNIGLSIAKGKWLLFADSDDKFITDLEDVVRYYSDSEADIIYFRPESFNGLDGKLSVRHIQQDSYVIKHLEDKTKLTELKLRYYFLVPWSKMIRKKIVDKNNIKFEEIMVSNDILFSAKTGHFAQTIEASNISLYSVRQREGSLTSIIGEKNFKIRFNAWIDYIMFLKNNLHEKEYSMLNISAIPLLMMVLKNKLGLKNYWIVIKTCKKNGVPLLDKRLLNPLFTINSLLKFIDSRRVLNKTEVNETE